MEIDGVKSKRVSSFDRDNNQCFKLKIDDILAFEHPIKHQYKHQFW